MNPHFPYASIQIQSRMSPRAINEFICACLVSELVFLIYSYAEIKICREEPTDPFFYLDLDPPKREAKPE